MKRFLAAALLAPAVLAFSLGFAQQRLAPRPESASREQQDLETALSEAGSSPLEYLRAIDKHLERYPDAPRRPELERAAARAAMEARDDRRIILYGERVLARQPDDLQILERVTRALIAGDSRDAAERTLKYARRLEELVRQIESDTAHSGMSPGEWKRETSRALGRALAWEARATGNLGRAGEALALARRAFDTDPTAESAREIARWSERLDRFEDAACAMADAFTIPDPRTTDADRSRDRVRLGELWRRAKGSETGLGELWRRAKGSETGLGDLVLEAYDRNVALLHTRELALRAGDPNAGLSDPMEFTLTGPDAARLQMAGLKGKVVVFDFWATWCVPCRVQHPLLEQVKARFRDNPDVVFLSVSADEDRGLVKPFLAEVQWNDPAWFEDGLSRALKISSIPTTLLIGKDGKIFSRMDGFNPQRFVETLTARIREALR